MLALAGGNAPVWSNRLAPPPTKRFRWPRLAMPVHPKKMHPAVPSRRMLSQTSRHRATLIWFGSPLWSAQPSQYFPNSLAGDPYRAPDLLQGYPFLPLGQDKSIAFRIAGAHHRRGSLALILSLTRFSISRYACQGYEGENVPPGELETAPSAARHYARSLTRAQEQAPC